MEDRITLTINATTIEDRSETVYIRGDYSFAEKPGTFVVGVTPDKDNDDWVLCWGKLDGEAIRYFATIRSAHELHRGIAWLVTQQKLLWNDLRIDTEENLFGRIDMVLKGEVVNG